MSTAAESTQSPMKRYSGMDALRLLCTIAVVHWHSSDGSHYYGNWRMPTMALVTCWLAIGSRSLRHKELVKIFALWCVLYILATILQHREDFHAISLFDHLREGVIESHLWFVPFALVAAILSKLAMTNDFSKVMAVILSFAVIQIPCPFSYIIMDRWWQVLPCIGIAVACRSCIDDFPIRVGLLVFITMQMPRWYNYSIAIALVALSRHIPIPRGTQLATISRGVYWIHPFVILVLYKFQIQSPVNAVLSTLTISTAIIFTPFRRLF